MPTTSTKNVMLKKLRAVRDSWVMLDEHTGFVPLPRERILFTSPPRTTLVLQTPNSYPGKEPLAIQSSAGTAFLTNQRVSTYPILRCCSLLTGIQARLPTSKPDISTAVLLCAYPESPGYTRVCTILWPECMDWDPATCQWRRHTTTARICRNKNDFQGRRSI